MILPEVQKQIVDTPEKLEMMFEALLGVSEFALDLETTGLDPFTDKIVGVSVAWGSPAGILFSYYIPIAHKRLEVIPKPTEYYKVSNSKLGYVKGQVKKDQPAPDIFYHDDFDRNVEWGLILKGVKNLFKKDIKMVCHNSKFERAFLTQAKLKLDCRVEDTQIMLYIIDVNADHTLKKSSLNILGYEMKTFKQLTGKNKVTVDMLPLEDVADYAMDDAWCTLLLYYYSLPLLKDNLELYELDLKVAEVVCDMELDGVKVDTELLKVVGNELNPQLKQLEARLEQIAFNEYGHNDFNHNSPAQLSDLLFTRFKLPVIMKTPGGKPSTKVGALELIKNEHEVVDILIRIRVLEKLLGTYVEKFPDVIHPKTGRVHCSFNMTATVTGRASCSDPSLQNIPTRTEEYAVIRKAFVGDKGKLLVGGDYSQIEMRVLAEVSQDPVLLEAYINNEDVHTATAAKINKKPLDKVTKEERFRAKSVNFGIIYGKTVFGFMRDFKCEKWEAQKFLDNYFDTYPSIKNYIDKTVAFAYKNGYIKTLLGRKRYLNMESDNFYDLKRREREAVNTSIQGSAADLLRLALVNVSTLIHKNNLRRHIRLILQVHDELILECCENRVNEGVEVLKIGMELGQPFSVPLVVEPKIGKSWYDIK